jgi:hypothetical protein
MKLKLKAADNLTAQQLLERDALLADLSALQQKNPLAFVRPYEKQRQFLAATEFKKAFFGGNGSGKTYIGLVDDLIQAVPKDFLPANLLQYKRWEPPFDCRIVCPKWNVVDTVIEKLRQIVPADALWKKSFDDAFSKQKMRLQFDCGSRFLFNTSDQDRDAHASVELHRVHFDEEPAGEAGFGIYTENLVRLRSAMPHAQVMFTMTPLFGLSWTYDEIWEKRDDDNIFCVVASMRDNPFIDATAMIKELDYLPEAERQAIIEGNFVHFHGLVLADWDERNEIEPPSIQHVHSHDTIIVSIDPGATQAAVTWNCFDKNNKQIVFDELYPTNSPNTNVDNIAKEIRRKNYAWKIPESRIIYVIDPSARNSVLTNGENVEGVFAREGIFTTPGQNPLRAGVLELRSRVAGQTLLVSKECTNVLKERRRWVVHRDESDTQHTKESFSTKGAHHTWDTIRYAAMFCPWTHTEITKKSPHQGLRFDTATGLMRTPYLGSYKKPFSGPPMGKYS